MSRDDVDFGRSLQSFEERQFQQPTLPSLPASSSSEPSGHSDASGLAISNALINLLATQRRQVDQYLRFQNERLAQSLLRQRKRCIASIKYHLEQEHSMLLKVKDKRLEMMNRQYLELFENVKKIEELKNTWERIVNEKGATISSLTNTLEQLLQHTHISTSGEAGKDEHCGSVSLKEEKGQAIPTRVSYRVSTPCKCCGFRDACMLFLPCRHICACKECETFLGACCICGSVKNETIEVLLN